MGDNKLKEAMEWAEGLLLSEDAPYLTKRESARIGALLDAARDAEAVAQRTVQSISESFVICKQYPSGELESVGNDEVLRCLAAPERVCDPPKIVCLCGSTRFTGNMLVRQWEYTKAGYIVLSWCALPEGYFAGDGAHGAEREGIKEEMDELHKRKIDLADEVHIINLGGYIGESTRSEYEYAVSKGKPITWEEPSKIPPGCGARIEAKE